MLAPAETSIGHQLYRDVSASQLYYRSPPPTGSDRPDPPHPAEPDPTYFTGWDGGGAARADMAIGQVGSIFWDGWEWCHPRKPEQLWWLGSSIRGAQP